MSLDEINVLIIDMCHIQFETGFVRLVWICEVSENWGELHEQLAVEGFVKGHVSGGCAHS